MIRQTRAVAHQTAQRLHGVEHSLLIARGQLKYANLQLARSQLELHRSTVSLHNARQRYSQTRVIARNRLNVLYQHGEQGYLSLLLSSDDFGDFLQRAQFTRYLMAQDRRTMGLLSHQKAEVAQYQQQVQVKTQEAAVWQQRKAIAHNHADAERRVVNHQLTVQQADIARYEQQLAELEQESRNITAWLRLLQNTSAGRRRLLQRVGPINGWPVAGRLSSGFGMRYHPILHCMRMHTGVDISAPMGTPIYATGAGEIIWAGWRRGYGNTVMIDHGGGVVTLYGHMSSIAVSAGQMVSKRQMIGRVGSTGMSTGPHCHYERRVNGTPVNPL